MFGETIHVSPGGNVSRSLNKATLIGNVGNDPEVRTTTGGSRVAQVSLATTRQWNGTNGEKQEKTEWHRLVLWNTKGVNLADIVERYVKKGDRLYVEGRIEYRQWQDREGQTRYTTEINVRELIMLSSRSGGDVDNGGRSRSSGERARAGAAAASGAEAASKAPGDDFEDFPGALEDEDDDLPF
ncbi:MAG: single-stranded DNA-binding protein [Gemmatimonadaceae bacterium]